MSLISTYDDRALEILYAQAPHTVKEAEFKSAAGAFSTGVVIVTARHDDNPVGVTLQSFASLSLDPLLISVALAKTSATLPQISDAGQFCVNILGETQRDLALHFAKSAHGTDKFAEIDYTQPANAHSPVFAGSLAWIECSLERTLSVGDHVMLIGAVTHTWLSTRAEDRPLVFWRSGFQTVSATACS